MPAKVVVGLSGGVDSSVAAALLLRQGYQVVGVTLRHLPGDTPNSCCSLEAVVDARRVAKKLGIPHALVDVEDAFFERVIEPFQEAYLAGTTPNPCAMCNRFIKFGAMWEWARDQGADFLATGHYVRRREPAPGHFELLRAVDRRKDQSYLLYHFTQDDLAHCLFPLGDYEKAMTRAMAEEWGLVTARKADSQELCFVPKNDYAGYLRANRPEASRAGEIVDETGNVLGTHEGVAFYTVGQRKGLGITAPEPLYVLELDAGQNRVTVGPRASARRVEVLVGAVSYVDGAPPPRPFRGLVKVRYNMEPAPAVWTPVGSDGAEVVFDAPQWAVTPGQIATLYDGDRVVGGGRIRKDSRGEGRRGDAMAPD